MITILTSRDRCAGVLINDLYLKKISDYNCPRHMMGLNNGVMCNCFLYAFISFTGSGKTTFIGYTTPSFPILYILYVRDFPKFLI